jgi:parvulin-like peptidyl-prolyl isomerase
MNPVADIGKITVNTTEIIPLLTGFQMLPHLYRFLIIDEAISRWNLEAEDTVSAVNKFCEQNQLTTPEKLTAFLNYYKITEKQLETLAIREIKLEKFKIANWSNQVESYFFNNKKSLDKVIYSLIRTKDLGIAQELFFRIQAGEQSFAECAKEYSQGPEAQTSGLIGPVDLNTPHPTIAKMLSISQPGEVLAPIQLGEWVVILRLEKLICAQLDDNLQRQIINRLFENWLTEQIHKLEINWTNDNSQLESNLSQIHQSQINQNIITDPNLLISLQP